MSTQQEDKSSKEPTFSDLALPEELNRILSEVGYEKPSPIQAEAIPVLLAGKDIIGQAQTGTGKTAAFALPLLAKIDIKLKQPQALVLAPTRELAIQVAEAINTYAKYLKGLQVVPIYGGQSFPIQLKQLARGPQVIVGTPGRVMDHMRKGKIKWDAMHTLVLDEADEMLRMGFLEDVEWVLEQTPSNRQIALFSATMPKEVKRVAERFLNKPREIRIKTKTATASTIDQSYLTVSHHNKIDALTRILEVEETDAMIIFARTKNATTELADRLSARGFAAAAINGDMAQAAREKTIEQLKNGRLDILVATDVAARGLDVTRISHVINYDITQDVESYVHRIGRTGRAGREGKAILFVTPREKRMLYLIEKTTGKKINRIALPSTDQINDQRVERFKAKITEKINSAELAPYLEILQNYQLETDQTGIQIAAALASLAHEKSPLLVEDMPSPKAARKERPQTDYGRSSERKPRRNNKSGESRSGKDFSRDADRLAEYPDIEMRRYVMMVGFNAGIKPGNVVGAIANEIDIESQYIGHIKIYDDFSTVDLPGKLPKSSLSHLKKVRLCGKPMNLTKADDFNFGKLKSAGDNHQDRKEHSAGKKYNKKPRRSKN
ncbi:MAG: DEAD/DEAH box helicase [Enterobacterales bacterium]|nr:DEAD/DEAH box helicase [Enterobacterales bacterium]